MHGLCLNTKRNIRRDFSPQRLIELEREKVIGKVAETHYSSSCVNDIVTLLAESVPQLLQKLKDVENAFDYYMAHYNKDSNHKPRPFILAGHSQGSNLLLMLVIAPFALQAPGNYQNLNPPYNEIPGWYHNYDYSFFFFNLEQNVIDRIASYNASR